MISPRTAIIAASSGLIGLGVTLWLLWEAVPRAPDTVREIVPRWEGVLAKDPRSTAEHQRTMRWIMTEMPSKRRLTEADARRLLAIVESPPAPDTRILKRERYPDREIPEDVVLPIREKRRERNMAAGVLSAWLQTGQPMDPGVRERIIAWIVARLDHEDPRERAAGINNVLDTRLLRERPDLRPKIEALRDDPDDHVALVARLQLERYDERESLKKAWEAKHANR